MTDYNHDAEDLFEACGFTEKENLKYANKMVAMIKKANKNKDGRLSKIVKTCEDVEDPTFRRWLIVQFTRHMISSCSE